MILTDREIQLSIENKLIEIAPIPTEDSYSATSLDLTLGKTFIEWMELPGQPIRPHDGGYRYSQLTNRQKKIENDRYELNPRSFVLGWTEEKIALPVSSKIAARIEGKSSIARLGVGIHVTAPTIHAGFVGRIQLEIFNFGPNCIELDAGMKICQLIFETTLGTPSSGYQGMFLNQQG